MPRYLTESEYLISLPHSLSGLISSGLYFLVNITATVFDGLTVSPVAVHQVSVILSAFMTMPLRVVGNLPLDTTAISSA